jgi:hypothetical protein
VQQHVHHAQAAGVGHPFVAPEGHAALEAALILGQFEQIVGRVLDVAVSRDQEAAGSSGGVLDQSRPPAAGSSG